VTDARILALAAAGDAQAWTELLGRHAAFAHALAARRLRRAGYGPAEAEEVVQQVWVWLLRNAAGVRLEQEGLRPYLAVAVLNAVRTWLRAESRRAAREISHPLPPAPGTPEDPLLDAERAAGIGKALSCLEEEDQLLIRWVYWGGLSYPQVARLLRIPENSVGPRLTRVRERVKGILGGEGKP
jgi:RNA polymerase sigma-70 factor (ECF subfamily)